MGSRYEVELTIISAKDLKNVNWRHGKIKPYAVVWVDPRSKCSSRVDEEGDTSPYWNETLTIPVNSAIDDDSTLHIDIVHAKEAAESTKPLIGSAIINLRDLVFGRPVEMKLGLKRPSLRPHGKVEIKVSVRELRYRAPDPYYAPPYGVPPTGTRDYPAPPYGAPPTGTRDYPAPPYGAPAPGTRDYPAPTYGSPYSAQPAYAAPPSGYPAAYGAPPPIYGQPSYGQAPAYGQNDFRGQQGGQYGQQQGYVEEKKKSKFGGMGTGLAVGAVAGILGGIALTEGASALEDHIADDVADRVNDDDYDGDDY